MDEFDLLAIVGSSSRQRVLELLDKGVDHPEDMAHRLKLRRQSVDKQLLELYACGFVDRSAIFPADGRPRIVYRISERGREFLDRVGAVVREFCEGMRADYRRSLGVLEGRLAAGDLDEEAYLKQRRTLEARYGRYIGGAPPKP